jgi:hypothetical protein
MKKKNYLKFCLIGALLFTLSSCGDESAMPSVEVTNHGYKKDIVDGYYTYNAKFENGTNKTYKLKRDITATVDGNTLICAKNYERFVIDFNNNSITLFNACDSWWKNNGIYKSNPYIKKTVVEVNDGSIDRWIHENMKEEIIPEYYFNNEKYSYTLMPYEFNEGYWHMDYYNSEAYSYEYDSKGNETLYLKGGYQSELGFVYEYKYEKFYNEDDQITKQAKYFLNSSNEYEFSGYLVYSYDSNGNFIKKECNKVLDEYTYDDNNNLIKSYEYNKTTDIADVKEYVYDSNNNLINIKNYTKPVGKTELNLESENTFTYDENNHVILETLEYVQHLDESQLTWMCCGTSNFSYRQEYKYENDELVYEHTILYRNDLNDIVSDTERFYTQDEVKEIVIYPNDKTCTTIFDSNGNILSFNEIYTSSDNEISGYKINYNFDENKNLISSITYNIKNSDSTISCKEENVYDSNNNLLMTTKYDYGKHLGKRIIYSYDENGFLTKELAYVTSDNETYALAYEFEVSLNKEEYKVLTSKIYDNYRYGQLIEIQ